MSLPPNLVPGKLQLSSGGIWFARELDRRGKVRRVGGEPRQWPIGNRSELSARLVDGPCDLLVAERPAVAWPLRLRRGRAVESAALREHPVLVHQGTVRAATVDRVHAAARDLTTALSLWGPPAEEEIPPAWRNDELGPSQQVVHYAARVGQQRYAHMYAAKHLALWRGLRLVLDWQGGPNKHLTSVGAGPLLDIMGWCWDRSFPGEKLAIDPLGWEAVLGVPAWARAVDRLCGTVASRRPAYVPHGPKPSQIRAIDGAVPVFPDEFGQKDTVLLPFVVNHLLGPGGAVDDAALRRLAGWLRSAAGRGARVAVADLYPSMPELWMLLLKHLGLRPHLPGPFRFAGLAARFSPLYPANMADYRTYASAPHGCTARVLVHDQGRWRFVEDDIG